MKPLQCYKQLEKESLPYIKAFKKDLLCWDKKALFEHAGTSFLHFTRETGTHIVLFHSADKYPKKDELVKYLFGRAGRDHILNQVNKVVEYLTSKEKHDLIFYFNGKTLKKIDKNEALNLTKEYVIKTRRQFN